MASTIRSRVDLSKYKANRVHRVVKEKFLQKDLIDKPLWFDSVCKYPPKRIQNFRVVHRNPKAFAQILIKSPDSSKIADEYCRGLSTKMWEEARQAGGSVWKTRVTTMQNSVDFPRDISFPEDKLRKRFIEEHPLEILRPINMKEDFRSPSSVTSWESVNDLAKALYTGAKVKKSGTEMLKENVVDLESAVRYQMKLIQEDGMDEQSSYEETCKIFYENRSQAEAKERERLWNAVMASEKQEDQEDFKPAAQEWIDKEQEILENPTNSN